MTPTIKKRIYIIYIGGFLNERIVNERQLPTRNPAGSNRMQRIANALQSAGQPVLIVSPGTCLRPKFTGIFIHSLRICRTKSTPVIFSPAIGVRFLSAFSSYIFLPLTLLKLFSKKDISAVIIYNFSPLLVILSAWIKWILRIPVFQNIEDVSIPELTDWIPGKEVRPFQELIFSVCMKFIAWLSNGLIVPTKRFLKYVALKPNLVITGCIAIIKNGVKKNNNREKKIQILFAGKIGDEHGISLFVETLFKIDQQNDFSDKIEVNICGSGVKSDWLSSQCERINTIKVKYHGFVNDQKYKRLLEASNVCVALQDPTGRYATYKTPSKVYEYLGNAKAVIATDVGDLVELPEDVITICTAFNASELYDKIESFVEDSSLLQKQAQLAGKYAREHFGDRTVGTNLRQFIEKNS